MPQHRTVWLGVAVLLIAAFARLYQFGDVPPGLQHDEIFKAQEGRALIEHGDFRLFYPSNQGHEGLYVWLLGWSYILFGTSVTMVKFPAFVCGMLTVALTYRVLGEILNRRIGFIAAGLTAVSFWAVFVSRVGLRANTLPVLALLVAWGVWRVVEPRRHKVHKGNHSFLIPNLTGIALGLAVYTYTSSFALYIAFGVFCLTLAVFKRQTLLASWRQLALVAVIAAALALPMVYIRLSDPQGANRVSTISRPLTDFLAGKPDELIGNAWALAGMPYFAGDPEWRYNVAGRPLFATPVGMLVYLGFGVTAWRIRSQPILAMFITFATIGLIPSLLTVSAPSFLRSILALPAVMLFIAVAVDLLPNNRAVWSIGIAAIVLTAATDWTAYFGTWLRSDEVHAIYRDDLQVLADYLWEQETPRALVSTTDTEIDPLLFQYYQPPDSSRVTFFDGRTTIALSNQPALLFISPLSQITPPHVDWLTPLIGTVRLQPLHRNDGEIAYEVYQLNASAALEARLEQVQTQPVYLYAPTEFPRGDVANWAQHIEYPVNFANIVQLVGVDLPRKEIATEYDGVNIQLYFQPLVDHVELPLNIFVHMSRLDGTIHAQRDLLGVPTIQWTTDLTIIQDNFVIAGPTLPGRYIITMGVYNFQTGERLPVMDETGTGDRLVIDRVRVVAR